MKAVITGATGMIASALIRVLIGEGHEVFAVCRPGSKKLCNIPPSDSVHIIEADITELSAAGCKISCGCDALFHFAWGGTSGAARNDAVLQAENIRCTLDAVELAAELGCKVFVGAGSQAEYGRVEGKLTPDTPCFPENGYGMAKLAAGQLSRIAARQHGIRHIWARILSVYGVGDNPFTITVSSLTKLIKGERAEFTPAEQLWDFLNCDDAGRAFYLMSLYGRDGAVYPLGSGEAKPLGDYIETMHRVANPAAEVAIGALPYNDKQVMHLCADISALTADTGFVPAVKYEDGIRKTVEWLKKR